MLQRSLNQGKAQLVRWQMVPKFFLKGKRSQRRRVITSFEQLASRQGKKRCWAVTTSCSTAEGVLAGRRKQALPHKLTLIFWVIAFPWSVTSCWLTGVPICVCCLSTQYHLKWGGCGGLFIEPLPGWMEKLSFFPSFLPASIPCTAPPVKLLGRSWDRGLFPFGFCYWHCRWMWGVFHSSFPWVQERI